VEAVRKHSDGRKTTKLLKTWRMTATSGNALTAVQVQKVVWLWLCLPGRIRR